MRSKSPAIFDSKMQALIEALCKSHQFDPYVGKGNGIKFSLPNQSFMPLHVDSLMPNLVSVSHTYIQYGDVMRDPEITYIIVTGPSQTRMWIPSEYRQDNLGIRQILAQDTSQKLLVNERAIKDLLSFTRTWTQNLRDQGFCDEDVSIERFE